jgi:hypothetical protein
MPSEINHECFVAPVNKDVKIWRYMDFTKFISLLETESLFLSRADKFEDPYEGSWSKPNIERRPNSYAPHIPTLTEPVIRSISRFSRTMRSWTYINCWHMNERESAAMWKLYARTNEAVTIQSSYAKLHGLLPQDTYVGVVNYIDYDLHHMPDGNILWPYVHKRLSFEHERELRVFAVEFPTPNDDEDGIDLKKDNPSPGRFVQIDLAELIERVHVSPTAPTWFFKLVSSVIRRYGYGFDVTQSDMTATPLF